jgi:hypothetical protein
LINLTVLAAASLFGEPELDAALRKAPSPVRSFVERLVSCEHWAGEEPYDADRRREIERALRIDRCDRIDIEGREFRRRYARRPEILRLFDAAAPAD